jgi:hypothetical protein
MHAIVVTAVIAQGQFEAARASLNDQVVQRVKQMPGFVKGYWTIDDSHQHGSSVIVFSSQEDAQNAANGVRNTPRPAGVTIVSAGGLMVGVGLNLPWLVDVYRTDGAWAAIGAVKPASPLGPTLGRLLVFHSGPVGSVLGAGLAAAALVAVFVSRGWRASWAIRACAIATVFFAMAWADGRDWLPRPFAMPELFLASAAAGVALAVSMGGAAPQWNDALGRGEASQMRGAVQSMGGRVAVQAVRGSPAGMIQADCTTTN